MEWNACHAVLPGEVVRLEAVQRQYLRIKFQVDVFAIYEATNYNFFIPQSYNKYLALFVLTYPETPWAFQKRIRMFFMSTRSPHPPPLTQSRA